MAVKAAMTGLIADPPQQPGDLQIPRAEFVTPKRNTVGIVHGDHADFGPLREADERAAAQPLGRDVQELVFSVNGVLKDPVAALSEGFGRLLMIRVTAF